MSLKKNKISSADSAQTAQNDDAGADLNIVFLDAASDSNDEAVRELLDKTRNEREMRSMLTFQDGDMNTALHFGAKNGNLKICSDIIDEATRIGIVAPLVNCCNRKGFSPLLEVSLRGYHLVGDIDESY